MQFIFTALGGFLGWYVGGMDGFLYALLAFMLIDYITGVMNAILKKRLSSEIGAKGIFKKVLILALVGLGHVIDTQVLGQSQTIRTAGHHVAFHRSKQSVVETLRGAGRRAAWCESAQQPLESGQARGAAGLCACLYRAPG